MLEDKVIDEYIQYKKDFGKWVLFSKDGKNGAQFTIPKEYSPTMFWLGLATFWIYGIGIVIWIVGIIGYFAEERQIVYIDVRQMRKELEKQGK